MAAGLGQAKAPSEFHLGLSCGWQGLRYLGHLPTALPGTLAETWTRNVSAGVLWGADSTGWQLLCCSAENCLHDQSILKLTGGTIQATVSA